jgi:hypothetical protein
MTGTYGAGKVCPYEMQNCDLATEGLTLEPGISAVIDNAASHSWEELEYYWKEWRDASGRKMRGQFSDYIQLSNVAAVANGIVLQATEHNAVLFFNVIIHRLERRQRIVAVFVHKGRFSLPARPREPLGANETPLREGSCLRPVSLPPTLG